MFRAECDKIIHYDLEVSEDIVKFCQWVLDSEQEDTLYDNDTIVEFLDAIANKSHNLIMTGNEINIEYYK